MSGLSWRRRKRLPGGANLNLSKSGASVSKRVGRVSISSSGRISIRLFRGVYWRGKL